MFFEKCAEIKMHNDDSKMLERTTFAEIAKKSLKIYKCGCCCHRFKRQYIISESLTGYSVDELIGKKPRILQSGLHDKKFYEKMWEEIKK
jgi:hypothetical protein